MKLIDKAIFGMVSESPGRNGSEPTGGPDTKLTSEAESPPVDGTTPVLDPTGVPFRYPPVRCIQSEQLFPKQHEGSPAAHQNRQKSPGMHVPPSPQSLSAVHSLMGLHSQG